MKRLSFACLLLSALSLLLPASMLANDKEKSSAMRLGRMKAMSCAGCHGMNGKGIEKDGKWVAPGYADSTILKSGPEELALIILKGIQKESEHYSAAMGGMEEIYDDRSLAAVMTWVRNQFGEHDDYITTEQAAEWREKFSDRPGPIALGELGK